MKRSLKKLKLIDHLHLELNVNQETFRRELTKKVRKSKFMIFSNVFDLFSSSQKEYKGQVTNNSFEIRKRDTFFDGFFYHPTLKGTYNHRDDKLIVNVAINGFSRKLALQCVIILYFF